MSGKVGTQCVASGKVIIRDSGDMGCSVRESGDTLSGTAGTWDVVAGKVGTSM